MFPSILASVLSGIDISRYQKKIDWAAVTASGIHFCFIKATEGANLVDPMFKSHWESAGKAGLIRGAYHFFRPKAPVPDQVDLFVRTVGGLAPGDLRPALDLEVPEDWANIPVAKRTPLALAMLEAMEARLGAIPIIYAGPKFVTGVLKNAVPLARFPIWIAQYTLNPAPAVPKPWNNWTLWQHSEKGKIAGIPGFVDLNRFQGTLADFQTLRVPAVTEVAETGPKPGAGAEG
jgi:lysozyme